jgi:hypothetical protein
MRFTEQRWDRLQGKICTRLAGGLGFAAPEGQRDGRMECDRRRFISVPTPIEPLTK